MMCYMICCYYCDELCYDSFSKRIMDTVSKAWNRTLQKINFKANLHTDKVIKISVHTTNPEKFIIPIPTKSLTSNIIGEGLLVLRNSHTLDESYLACVRNYRKKTVKPFIL